MITPWSRVLFDLKRSLLSDFSEWGLVARHRHYISASPMVPDKIWCRKAVSVECLMSQDRSWTFMSELPQGIPEVKRGLKRTLETLVLRQRVPVNGYRVLVRLWTPIKKIDLKLIQENYRFVMSTFQFNSDRISIDFNNSWPVVTLFHNFLGFHMILTSKYCNSDEKFIKNSPLLNTFSNRDQIGV